MVNSTTEHPRTEVVTVRMTPELKRLAQKAAEQEAATLSCMIRRLLFDRVRHLLQGADR